MVLVLVNFVKNDPWMKSFKNLHLWSLKFQHLAILVPGHSKMEKLHLLSLGIWNMACLVLMITSESWQHKPLKNQQLHFWSLCFTNLTNRTPLQTKTNKPKILQIQSTQSNPLIHYPQAQYPSPAQNQNKHPPRNIKTPRSNEGLTTSFHLPLGL